MPAGGGAGGGLVLHVRGYFWKSYSQVIRASPGCYEVCPRLVVSPHPDLCKRVGRCTQCVLTRAPAVMGYAFSVGTRNSKIFRGKEQKNKNSKAKTSPVNKERWHDDDGDDGCNNNRRLTVQWHDVVGSGMMKVKAHASCQGETR